MLRVLVLLMVAASCRAHPQEQLDNPAIGLSRSALKTLVDEGGVPGLQVAVWHDGRLVWSEAFGHASLELQTPATTTTKFRVASISKAMTGTLLASLAATDRIDLDRPVGEYIQTYPAPGERMTARQLASHTSGMRHYRGDEISSVKAYPTMMSALSIFASDELIAEPGEKYSYSTYGFTALGAVMEAATGQKYFELLRDEILLPLEMSHTVVDERTSIIAERSCAYEMIGDLIIHARPTDHSYKIPGGGMLSTAEDLVRLGAAVMAPGVLDASVVELVQTPTTLSSGREIGYSLGWNVRRGDEGVERLWHTGSQPGSRCVLLVKPARGLAVAILCNARAAPMGVITADLVASHFERTYSKGPAISPVGVYEIAPQGEPEQMARVDIWEENEHYRGMITLGKARVSLPTVHVVENTVVAHAYDGRLVELTMVVRGDEVEAVLRTSGSVAARGRRVSSEAFAVTKDH